MKANFFSIQKVFAGLIMTALISPALAVAADAKSKAKALSEEQKILHVLNRLGFGARPGEVEKVKAVGVQKYIEQQLNPDSINDSATRARLKNFEILEMTTGEIFAKYPNPGALLRMLENEGNITQNNRNNNQDSDRMSEAERRERQRKIRQIYQEYDLRPANQIIYQQAASRIIRAVYSERQLEEAMVDFWMNHFNVYAGKAAVRWYIPSYERDVIRKNALGNFKDLVVGTAQHPAMLFYLDNFQSISPKAQSANNRQNRQIQRILETGQIPPRMRENLKRRGFTDEQIEQRLKQLQQTGNNQQRNQRGINENYARELMELHTLGVDGGYTQKDIVEVARAFTGWTIADARGYRSAANMINERENRALNRLQRMAGVPDDLESGEFYFNERWHDTDEKIVLGQKIKEGGIKEGLKVIDILVAHPSTAKFIARKLAVKFVSDKPSEALVNRVAEAFQKSNGDIKTTLRVLFSDREFFAAQNYRAKIKTPFELLVSSLRALDADVKGSPALLGLLQKMGEPLYGYQAPTGYPDTAEDWVNTGALLERMNFAVALSSNRIPQVKVDLSKFAANSKPEILNQTVSAILAGEIAPATKQSLLKQIEQPLPELKLGNDSNELQMSSEQGGNRRNSAQMRLLPPSGNPEVFKVVGLLLGSPDFQRQ